MTSFQIAAVVLALTSMLAYVNAKLLKLPASVGLMATALVGSVAVLALEHAGVISVAPAVRALVAQLDFGNTLLHGMLGILLFAGALHIDLADLGADAGAIGLLAVGSTLASVALVGAGTYVALGALGHAIDPLDALLFGALIAPTDPIAVLGMLKTAKAPKRLEVRIAGESLFNDGVGVVVFTVVLALASGNATSLGDAALLFGREVVGGAVFGFAAGYLTLRLVRGITDYTVEVMLTLTLVIGGYALAEVLGVSAPIAAVCAGLAVGNHGARAITDETRAHLDSFWRLLDEVLNAVLFLMMGLVVLIVPVSREMIGAALLAIPIALLARWGSVAAAIWTVPHIRRSSPHSVKLLTWGGLRGGLSIAMALAIPVGDATRDRLLVMTYAVVAFSILVQGLTFGPLLRRLGIGGR